MKYISSEELEREINEWDDEAPLCFIRDDLLSACKEIDQLTVTKLRPMSDANNGDIVLAYDKYDRCFTKIIICKMHGWDQMFEGWIPLPQYKPEE